MIACVRELSLCICARMRVYMHVCVFLCVRVWYICARLHACMREYGVHVYVRVYVCVHKRFRVCSRFYVRMRMRLCVSVCAYAYVWHE